MLNAAASVTPCKRDRYETISEYESKLHLLEGSENLFSFESMEFLKSAVASAISKRSPFSYSFEDRVDVDTGIWSLFNGTKQDDSSKCSIFSFDINTKNKNFLPLARNTVKKLRTLRHPKVIKVLDSVESDSYIYIATERVIPLYWHVKRKSLSTETIKWGLFSVAQTIKFINNDAASIHGTLRLRSIFTSESGEWKVGGFELTSCIKEDDAIIYSYGSLLSDSRYISPEISKFGWDIIKKNPITAVDAYSYGILMSEIFSGNSSGNIQPTNESNIPQNIRMGYRQLTNNNPKARMSVGDFLDHGTQESGYFRTPLIALTETLDQLRMKSEQEKEDFLIDLDQLSDDLPVDYFKIKVLPELLNCIEFGGGGPNFINVVMNISKRLSDDEFEQKLVPSVVKLFSRPDRATRVCLLENLPNIIDRIPRKVVNDKLFPHMITGFTDIAPIVREQTIKAVLTVIDKLSDRTINGELLKYLAKTSNDEQPGIRTNTTICLGKISKNLSVRTRTKVLIAAFTRSIKDPFVHARNAALMALAVTSDAFSEDDAANRILPAICPCLIDKEKIVRDQANKTLDIYLKRLRKFAATMPNSALPPQTVDSSITVPQMSTLQPNEVASWTGWAISSFTNKISGVAGEIMTSNASFGPNLNPSNKNFVENQLSLTSNLEYPHSKLDDLPAVTYSEPLPELNANSLQMNLDDIDTQIKDGWNDDTFFDFPPVSNQTKEDESASFENKYEEPDFAGWLSAQAGKKLESKPLPKGLVRTIPGSKVAPTSTKSSVGSALSSKKMTSKLTSRIVAKKIDTTPDENEEEDGWGDSW